MRDKLIARMSHDLGLEKYKEESETDYIHRVLYSSLSCWIKASTLDIPLGESKDFYSGVSRKHLRNKVEKILNELLLSFPEAKRWFYGDEKKLDPVGTLIKRVLYSQDIMDIGFQTNIGIAQKSEKVLFAGILQKIGFFIENDSKYLGVAMIKTEKFIEDVFLQTSAVEWFENYCENAWWKKGSIVDDHTEYFDAEQYSYNNSLWKMGKVTVGEKPVLFRRTINNSSYEYILEKIIGGTRFHHKLDPFLQERREYRRIMFALRKINNNSACVWVTKKQKHVHIKLRVFLPDLEQEKLESFAWPVNSIDDRLEWTVGNEVWPYIKSLLLGLDLEIVED